MDNNQQFNDQYASQMMPPQQKIIMVTPYSAADDNNNPIAHKYILAAVICMCASRLLPTLSMIVMSVDVFVDMPYVPSSMNIFLYIVAIVILIVARVQYPRNSIAKGLLIGIIAQAVISLLSGVGALAILFSILSNYSSAEFSDFIYELMEIFGL